MTPKKIVSILLILLGEAIIIFCFLHFGIRLQTEVLVLNIIVSTIIYCLVFVDFFFPWVNLKDKSQKQIGSIGLRWFFAFFYLILALLFMVFFNSINPTHFSNQIVFHGILLFFLILGLFLANNASEKVAEIYVQEKQNRDNIDEMKKATKSLQLKLDTMSNVPIEIISRVNELQENLRYLSPSNNDEAIVLESKFVEDIKILSNCFSENPLNMVNVISNIKNCESTYKERKRVFSN